MRPQPFGLTEVKARPSHRRLTVRIDNDRATLMTALRDYNAAVDFVDRHVAEGRGDKIAFVDPSRNLTYGGLQDSAARIGPMLARMGIEPENRIALVLLDTVDFPILFWGAIRAGVVPVLVNTRLTVEQYRYLFEDSVPGRSSFRRRCCRMCRKQPRISRM